MKPSITAHTRLANYLVMVLLALVPFHAFITVWGSALVGHYTLLRVWDEILLLALLAIVGFWLATDKALRTWVGGSLLMRLIGAYIGLTLLLGVVSLVKGDVTLKAFAYGITINLRFLVWFVAVLLTAQRSNILQRSWLKLLLVPAGIVAVFAVLQYTVLPHTFLAHFGYNAEHTIAPIETINHNAHYIRVQSTLRGANPLGAYLVIILSALGMLLAAGKRRLVWSGFGMVTLAALFASGSRSAWIGAVLSLAVIAWFWFDTRRSRLILSSVAVGVAVLAAGAFLLLRDNTHLQNELLHTQDNSAVAVSSNGAHVSAFKSGLADVAHQPLGDGPGTAGPASAYNSGHPVRIAEDYYVQIAQETGWLGLALFLSVAALVIAELYQRMGKSRLAFVVFAAFVGISFTNILSHAWTDDTLAFVWWGLAGIALARVSPAKSNHET